MATIPVDVSGYDQIMFFKGEEAVSYETKEPDFTDDGEPLYLLSFAVSLQGRFNRTENDIIVVRVPYPKGKSPMVDLHGKQVKFERLIATPSIAGMNNKYLKVGYQADSVVGLNVTARQEAKANA